MRAARINVAKIHAQRSSLPFPNASSSWAVRRPNCTPEQGQIPGKKQPGQRLEGRQGFPYGQTLPPSWATGSILKLTNTSHNSPITLFSPEHGKGKAALQCTHSFSIGVAVPQHYRNIIATTTIGAGSRNNHPKSNVSGFL